MSLNASLSTSLRQNFRYPPPAVLRNKGLLRCVLLTSTLFVLGFCAILFLLHSFGNGTNGSVCGECKSPNVHQSEPLSVQCREICTTQACMKTAADMFSRMDIALDPCIDFYSFSCGKYDKISMIGKEMREQFMNEAAYETINVLSGLIQSIPKHLPQNVPGYSASKARNFYDSCVDVHSTEEMAIPSLLRYLDYFGVKNWPYLEHDYHFTNTDLEEAITRLALYEANIFFEYEILENSDDNFETNNTRCKGDTGCNLNIKVQSSRRTPFSGSISDQDLEPAIYETLNDFGLPFELINETIRETLAFDHTLGEIQRRSRWRIRKCTLNSTISCSAYQYDCSEEKNSEMEQWCRMSEKTLNATGLREKYPSFRLILQDKIYFKDITAIIASTSHRTIAHSMGLNFFLRNLILMNYRFRRLAKTGGMLKEILEKFQDERKTLCTSFTLLHLPALLGGTFYSKIYSGDLEKEADDIYSDIQSHLVAHIRNMTWMDRDARESLEELLWGVRISIKDILPYVSNPSELDEFYERLQITDESFFSNMMEIRKFRYVSQILFHDNVTLVIHREKARFQFNPNYQENIIVMDFSSFIFPLISKDRPRYSNLGFFGSFVAHELSHAVEVFLRDRENMSTSFENSLKEKKKCLIDQYSEYEIDLINQKVNGSYTLHENMADFFSIRPAYESLKNYQKKYGAQKALPGHSFTEEQMFFISYSQWWCENNTPETMKQYLDDKHSPGKYRVLGMMKNFEPFSAAFNCPLGSPMNPVQKCDF